MQQSFKKNFATAQKERDAPVPGMPTEKDVRVVHAGFTGGSPGFVPSVKKHKQPEDIRDFACVIHGERGIGKSTLSDQIAKGNGYHFMFERDASLEVTQTLIKDWPQFVQGAEWFATGKHNHQVVICDNGQVAYEMALQCAGIKNGFEHPGGMNDFGQSWAKVKKEFIYPFRLLMNCGKGLIVICHSQEKEIETAEGIKYIKIRPDWSKQADEFVGAFVENIFYYHYVGSARYLQLLGDDLVTAKCKVKNHFFTPDGDRVHRVPMGDSEQEAYENFMLAYNNKQKETFTDLLVKHRMANSFKKPATK